MIHDVISASYKGGYKIEFVFDDGKRGTIDFSRYLKRGGVFERFKDPDFFKNFKVDRELGVIVWQGGIDIAPETLYSEATGSPLPEWVEA
ncbi:MAG: DUF2442 domain-containing protein [Chloroflexi bacterium]|nr:DUF2442 domain-containing protein [Chloroflexota bacterium]